MNFENDTVEVKGLEQLLKALKAKAPSCRVGVLGGKNVREKEGNGSSQPTNAEVGAAHEFGTSTIPQRSFLRVPIADHLSKEMEESGALDEDTMKAVVREGTVKPWLQKTAILAEGIVAKAFESGGFGKWPAWKNKNYTNNTGQLLIDTQQLRNSVTSEVK